MTVLDTGNFYALLPEGCHLYTWSMEAPFGNNLYQMKVVLLLPDDKQGLTDLAEIRMEMYIQAETLIHRFRDFRMWKNPHIEIAGDSHGIEAYCELFIEASVK